MRTALILVVALALLAAAAQAFVPAPARLLPRRGGRGGLTPQPKGSWCHRHRRLVGNREAAPWPRARPLASASSHQEEDGVVVTTVAGEESEGVVPGAGALADLPSTVAAVVENTATVLENNFPPTSNLTAADAATFLWGGSEEMDEAAKAKWRNLVLLVAAGFYALSLLVTVDMEQWRGWTLQEILLRIPYDNWQEYETGLMTHPIFVKTVINVVIYLIGDWMSQVGWGRQKDLLDFDLARTARNGLIGAIFGPLVHYYYDFSDWILPMDVPVNRIYKIVMDQSIYFITKCSAYIALVGLLRGDAPAQVQQDVKDRLWPVVFRGWKFWPLAHIVTYGVIPPRHRVLWVNILDLVWSSILATLAAGKKDEAPAPAPTAAAPVTATAASQAPVALAAADEKRADVLVLDPSSQPADSPLAGEQPAALAAMAHDTLLPAQAAAEAVGGVSGASSESSEEEGKEKREFA